MDKKEYYLKQIAKTNKKNHENYIVTRILNLLDDLSLKFITQQPVILSNSKRALTDLYFPQIDLHIEIDELYHQHQIDQDKMREADIVNATNQEVVRIDASKDLDCINKSIGSLVCKIREIVINKKNNNTFTPWDIEKEYNAKTYIEKGYIDLGDKVAFKKIIDALECFGLSYKGCQKSCIKHPMEPGTAIWFPKFYENENWDNQISADGLIITERYKGGMKWMKQGDNRDFIKVYLDKFPRRRIVFASVIDSLGERLYRFKGVFEVDKVESLKRQMITHKRTAVRVKTYQKI